MGFPKPPEQMRGTARDFEVPADMRTPEALRPFAIGSTTDLCRASAIVPSKSP